MIRISLKRPNISAQGTIEYLVIVAIIVVLSLVVVGVTTNVFGNTGGQVNVASNDLTGKVGSGGINVLEGVSDSNGDVILKLQNNTGDNFSISKISAVIPSGSKLEKDFTNISVSMGESMAFSMDSLGSYCYCSPTDKVKKCEFEITFTSSSGLVKKQKVTKQVDCVSNTIGTNNVISSVTFAPVWLKGPAATASNTESVISVFIDSLQNYYAAGYFNSTDLNFGGSVKLTNTNSSYYDFFAVKYDSTGVALWAKGSAAATTRGEEANAITVDSSGNVYVVGDFQGADLNFGGAIKLTNTGSVDTADLFLVKYDSNGVPLWAKSTTSATTSNDYAYSVFVDSAGNVYVAGTSYSNDLNLGNGVRFVNPSAGTGYFFIAKYNSSGTPLWIKGPAAAVDGYSAMPSNTITVDYLGNVIVGGTFAATDLNFGGGVNISNARAGMGVEFFIVKYDSSGNPIWAKTLLAGTSSTENYVDSIVTDGMGNVYIGGRFDELRMIFSSDINIGGTMSLLVLDQFIAKYNSSGTIQWVKRLNPNYSGKVGLGIDPSQNLCAAVTIDCGYGTDFGNGITADCTGYSQYQEYLGLLKYSSSGSALLLRLAAASSYGSAANAMYVDTYGNIALGGDFYGPDLNLGYGLRIALTGSTDFFVTKYAYR